LEPEVSEETRRAPAAFAFQDASGAITARGQAEAVIDDDGLSVGAITVAFLDADTLRTEEYRIDIGCWPGGVLMLNQLGRRFDTFTAELRRSRDQARVAGFLAHGVAMPTRFPAAVLGLSSTRPVECQVYDTHITMIPEDGDPWQVPLGALTSVETTDEPPAVVLVTADGRTVIGLLARRRDEFHRAVTERRQAQTKLLQSLTGTLDFADGLGVERPRLPRFDALVERWTAPERAACATILLRAARGGEPRLGFVQLLDPDGEALQALPELPEHWASFLLVPVGPLTVLEILAGPSAATYVFEGTIQNVNRDLQLLHFRRAALALRGEDAEPRPGNSYRLALRRLEPLQRLRAATRARLIHSEEWADGLAKVLG
jgi:hypothetical protein